MDPDPSEAPSPWLLIAASDLVLPTAAAQHRLRRGVRSWLERLRGGSDDASDAVELTRLTEARMNALLPELPLAAQCEALRTALDEAGGRLLVLRPPDGSWDAALRQVAEGLAAQGWQRPAAPEARPPEAAPELTDATDGTGVAVVALERWFVRHHDGLAVCRQLLARLAQAPGGVLVGCDAWAWRFLDEALAAGVQLPPARLPAPLGGAEVQGWLEPSAALRLRGSGDAPGEAFYRALAAEARGLPGVVRALWGACLQRGADGDDDEESEEDDAGTLWVQAPSEAAPTAAGVPREGLLLLHALLLHGGASRAELARTLPLSEERLARLGAELRSAQLIERQGDQLRVAPLGYPAVRGRLEQEGFLVAVP